jgi:hypothetical protein
MATLAEIRRRIASMKNTQQITRAMQFVAASKLKRAQEAAREALAGDREVEDGALGRRPVEGVRRHLDLAHRIAFQSGFRHRKSS